MQTCVNIIKSVHVTGYTLQGLENDKILITKDNEIKIVDSLFAKNILGLLSKNTSLKISEYIWRYSSLLLSKDVVDPFKNDIKDLG
jgi:hypothetical protein